MLKSAFVGAVLAITAATPGFAACGKKPPVNNWNLQAGDKRVTGAYLGKLLPGKKVKFMEGGIEDYAANGGYTYKLKGKSYRSNGFRFYADGIRCIDYPNDPRYDLYVVNGGKLVLINWVGGRYVGQVLK